MISGLSYLIDRGRGNCTIATLASRRQIDISSMDNNKVRMKAVDEIFRLNSQEGARMNWTYMGTVGIESSVD